MSSAITTTSAWLEGFEQFDRHATNTEKPWLRKLRHEAFARFTELGFPSLKDEDWRFTSVASIAQTAFRLADGPGLTAQVHDLLQPYLLKEAAAQLVFVNGRYVPWLSRAASGSVVVVPLSEALVAHPTLVAAHLARYEDFHADAFTALNTSFLQEGVFVHVPKGVVMERPFYALYVSTGAVEPRMVHPRNLFLAGENSQATFVEDYVSLGAGTVFSNAITELVARESSNVEHYLIEREDEHSYNISTLRIQQERAANVASHSVLLGGALVRNNVHPVLTGEGGDCLINGLFVGRDRQHMDNYMKVEHAAAHCNSRQFYNGILDEHARGVFHGRIIVHHEAQKTDAKQTNRNLLLSDNAQIDTKPQLEIYADDVKCTHGATIGQIDEEALFYLRTRGVSEGRARGLLLYAFASESLDRMKPGPMRNMLGSMIPRWLPNTAFAGEIK